MAGERELVVAGRYRLRQRLGSGGGGSVWLAEDQELQAQVALKQFSVAEMPDEVSGDRITRGRKEALKAAQLREHPNVVTVYDVVEHEGRPWIVMEYLPGTMDLSAVVRERGPLPSAEVARIGAAALDGLSCGHRLGIIHRDVKPSNILLAPDHLGVADRRVLLTDYGISLRTHETRLTESGMVVGTVGYVAPERLLTGDASPASDLFSLGVTLYFAVEGAEPDGDTYDAVISAMSKTDPPVPRQASERLGQVIRGLLAKDPRDRIGADEAAELLAEALATEDGGSSSRASRPDDRASAPPDSAATSDAPRKAVVFHAAEGGPAPSVARAVAARTSSDAAGQGRPVQPGRASGEPEQGASADGPGHGPAGAGGVRRPPPAQGTESRREPQGLPRAVGWRTTALLALVAVLVAGGGFALGAAVFGGPGDSPNSPKPGEPIAAPSPTVTRGVYPYGSEVGLREAPQPGQCLNADWKDGQFKGLPRIKLVDCHDDPEGQVIAAVDGTPTAGRNEAESVRAECTRRTEEVRATMAAPVLYVLRPEAGQSEPPRSACLLFLENATLGGPLGAYRKVGDEVNVTSLAPGDCFDSEKREGDTYDLTLADCGKPHREQAVGWLWASGDGSTDSVDMGQLCQEKYGLDWARGQGHEMTGWYSTDEEWGNGFRYVLCTVAREDGGELPAGKVKPAY
ncbi:protein kinase [Streptomyces sp. NPDC002018]|uniref:serine/threonine-protein kinase n=1 Tax=Streptomyces sp. NPDC002018 TaxID=3364629 RepID=UPI0036CA8694